MTLFRAPFYFLRHGETDVNRQGLVAGRQDVPMNETGRRQALAAAERLAGRGIDAIYSSPLARARATADCIAASLDLPVIEIAELAERGWGELEGKARSLRRAGVTPAGGETPEAYVERTLAGLAKIPATGLPLIVAHSGTFRVLCGELRIEADAVVNGEPMRFVPGAGTGWRVELLSR